MRLASLRALALPVLLLAAACGDDVTTPREGTDATVMQRKDTGILPGVDATASGDGAADSGVAENDTGTTEADTGTTPADTGTTPADTGTTPADTGVPEADTGVSPADTGVPEADTGVAPTDTGVPPADTGVAPTDSGVPAGDTGVAPADTGVPAGDSGVVLPDGGVAGNFDPNASAATLAQAICAFYDRCEPARLAATARTVAQCVSENTIGIASQFQAVASAVTAGYTIFDPAALEACRNAYTTADCVRGVDPGACTFFTGSKTNGQPCSLSSECQSSLFCTATAGTCGQCAPRAAVGQSCLNAACANGLACLQTGQTAFTCVALVDENATCGTAGVDDCRGHLWCTGTQPPYTCRRPQAINQNCTSDASTVPACDPFMGGACINNICQQVTYGGVNASCMAPSTCNTTATCTNNVCVARPAAGMACNQNAPCAEGFFCNSSAQCEARHATGQPCTASGECAVNLLCSGTAGSRTCQPPAYRACTAPTDAGVMDIGTPVDSGTPDAGTPADGGTPADTGTPVDGGTPADAGTIPSDPFDPATRAQAFAQAQCSFYQRCEPGRLQYLNQSATQCEQQLSMDLVSAYAVVNQAIQAGRARFSAAQFTACTNALATADCVLEPDANVCDFIAGNRTQGQACDRTFECGDELYCGITTPGATCGTCLPRRTQGQTCATAPCAPNLVCVQTGATTTACWPRANENQTCGSAQTGFCRGDLECLGTGAIGTCVRPAGLNMACTPDSTTAPDCNFDQRLACNAGTCVQFNWNGANASCAGVDQCNASTFCNAQNTCQTLPGNGQPCATADDLCASGAYCDAQGTCRSQLTLNQPCQDSIQCVGALLCLGTPATTCQADTFQVCN